MERIKFTESTVIANQFIAEFTNGLASLNKNPKTKSWGATFFNNEVLGMSVHKSKAKAVKWIKEFAIENNIELKQL